MIYSLVPFFREQHKADTSLWIPELTNGFDPKTDSVGEGMEPISFYTECCVPEGCYAIHVSLKANRDTGPVFLFTGRKQLQDILYLKKNQQFEQTYYQSVTEIIPQYESHLNMVEHVFFSYCTPQCDEIRVEGCKAERVAAVPRVFLCGDSTVTDQCAEIPYHPGTCYASWGQVLSAYLGNAAVVENQAHSGLTTESFRKEGHFSIVKHHLRPGDFCLFQFGHNDQKLSYLQASREYPENLKRYVSEVRSADAIPILVTPLGRNTWKQDGTYHDLLSEHAEAVARIASETDTRVIDLHEFSTGLYKRWGIAASQGYFHPGDYTHTNEYGAYLFASFIAEKLHEQFPEVFDNRCPAVSFIPPKNLWDGLDKRNNRTEASGEAGEFNRMEKSVKELL